jgi:hypothetical protein
MFVKPARLALGVAVMGPAIVTAGTTAAHADTPTPKNQCVVNAISAAQASAGQTSTIVCYATRTEALGAVSGGSSLNQTPAGPVTNSIPGPTALATYWVSKIADTSQGTLTITGNSCSDALYLTPDSWLPYMNAWSPNACSKSKNFTGSNFTGSSVMASNGWTSFDAPFAGNIRSIKFG